MFTRLTESKILWKKILGILIYIPEFIIFYVMMVILWIYLVITEG